MQLPRKPGKIRIQQRVPAARSGQFRRQSAYASCTANHGKPCMRTPLLIFCSCSASRRILLPSCDIISLSLLRTCRVIFAISERSLFPLLYTFQATGADPPPVAHTMRLIRTDTLELEEIFRYQYPQVCNPITHMGKGRSLLSGYAGAQCQVQGRIYKNNALL